MTHLYTENKRKAFLLLALLFGLIWQTHASAPKNLKVTPEPGWAIKLPARTTTKINPDHVNGGYHYLLTNVQYELALQETYHQYTYKLLTEEGVQNSSEIRLNFDPNYEQLLLHKVQVWRNGKAINKLDLAKVKVIQREEGMDAGIYDESLTAILVLDDIRVGDVIDYAYTSKGYNPVFGGKFFTGFNLQQYDPVDDLLVSMVVPQGRKLQFKYHLDARKPETSTSNGKTSYTWHLKNLPATKMDNNLPDWYDPYPGIYVSEFKSWQEVAQWALPLFEVKEAPSKKLQAKIDSIKASTGSDEGRVEAALHFVQDEVRYLGYEAGIGGYKPHMPNQVFANRFGDCKDKALLLAYMLRQMNIKASPALVNTTLDGHISKMLPSPSAFNHCVVRVELLGGKTYWYDATISKQRGSYNNIYMPAYGKALLLAPGTKALAAVSGPVTEGPTVKVREIYSIDKVGNDVVLEVRTEYSCAEADYQRSSFATTSMSDIEKNYLNFYANAYPEIEFADDLRFEDNELANIFTVIEKYNIPGFWQPQHANADVLEAWFSPLVFNSYISRLQSSKRTMPMALNHPVHVEQSIKVLLPQAWPVDNQDQEIDDEAFWYSRKITYSPKGTELNIDLAYRSKQDFVSPEATATYLRNQKAMVDNMVYGLTFNKGFVDSISDFKFSWTVGIMSLLTLVLLGFGAYKLYFWDPAPVGGELPYGGENLGGWVIVPLLGLIFTPFSVIVSFISEGYFNANLWGNISGNGAGAFLVGAEVAFNLALLAFSGLLITLYLKRRSSVPKLMVAFYVSRLAFMLLELALTSAWGIGVANEKFGSNLLGIFAGVAIWVPYFLLSSRVKSTFVERLYPQYEGVYTEEEEEQAAVR